MCKKTEKLIHNYWSHTELGQKMIASDFVSDDDLLFLIPNNVKRMHGIPATRTYGKRKSVIKSCKRKHILSFNLYQLVSDIFDEMIPKKCNNEFFDQFVDFKNIEFGDKNVFNLDPNNIITIPTTNKPVKLYLEDV